MRDGEKNSAKGQRGAKRRSASDLLNESRNLRENSRRARLNAEDLLGAATVSRDHAIDNIERAHEAHRNTHDLRRELEQRTEDLHAGLKQLGAAVERTKKSAE
jgi:hypothetical protein